MNWVTAHASVRGSSHLKNGKPCEDAATVTLSEDQQWAIAVLCDGAGSAEHAEEGAKFTSTYFHNSLERISNKLNQNQPGPWLTDEIAQEIINLRSSLRKKVGDENIHDYHCTLVACLLSDKGGFAIHIGDGVIFGESADRKEALISAPENGQYANETFFITEPHWIKHLRVTPIPKMLWVALCTDGGAALAMQNERAIKKGFVYPCIQAIQTDTTKIDANKVISEFLSDPLADAVTSDDKTLAFLISPNVEAHDLQMPPPDASNLERKPAAFQSIGSKIPKVKIDKSPLQEERSLPELIWTKAYLFSDLKKIKLAVIAAIFVLIFVFLAFALGAFFEKENSKEKNSSQYEDKIETEEGKIKDDLGLDKIKNKEKLEKEPENDNVTNKLENPKSGTKLQGDKTQGAI